jgi:hypothetical protein
MVFSPTTTSFVTAFRTTTPFSRRRRLFRDDDAFFARRRLFRDDDAFFATTTPFY